MKFQRQWSELVLRKAFSGKDVAATNTEIIKNILAEQRKMDILQSVYILQIIYQIVNLSPWIVKYDLWTFQRSRFLEFYSVLVIMAATGYLLYDLFSDDEFIRTNDNEIGQTVDLIQMVGIRLSHIASISEALIRRNAQKQFYEHLKEIDRIFECSLNMDMEYG